MVFCVIQVRHTGIVDCYFIGLDIIIHRLHRIHIDKLHTLQLIAFQCLLRGVRGGIPPRLVRSKVSLLAP